MNTSTRLSHHRLAAVFWLVVASCMCIAILAARMLWTHSMSYRFLVWNLFLAWVPLVFALLAERTRGLTAVAAGAAWLLFFPNAPYLLTDLVHLYNRNSWLFWVDLIMFLSFALTGLLLGYLSLYTIHKRLAGRLGNVIAWACSLGMLALCSFGIYLGRFERWNSWDVFLDPASLLGDVWQVIRHPLGNWEVYAVSGLLTAFLVVMYVALYFFARPALPERANMMQAIETK
jgi:uncharacterized membrane protein